MKGVIFDMDGTLLDTERLYRQNWHSLAVEWGQTPHPDFTRAIAGVSGQRAPEVIHEFYPDIDAKLFHTTCVERVKQLLQQSVPKKEGVDELLAYFRQQGMQIAIASSTTKALVEKYMKSAEVYDYFDSITGGEEITNGKPAPDIFLLTAERMGLSPTDCYVFEDAINGVRAGVAAGCKTIMIPDGSPATEEMHRICAGVYDDLLAVLYALKRGEI